MNVSKIKGRRGVVVALGFAIVLPAIIATSLQADDDKPSSDAEASRLAKDLIGTWTLAGMPDHESDDPAIGTRLKFFTGKHWTITQADKDGKVIFHHGGDYTLDGDKYTETIRYANDNTAAMIGEILKFTIKVDGDKYSQVGDGNPFTEDWERAK